MRSKGLSNWSWCRCIYIYIYIYKYQLQQADLAIFFGFDRLGDGPRHIRRHGPGRFLGVGQGGINARFVLFQKVLEEGIVQEFGALGVGDLW